MKTSEVLDLAADLIRERGWTQGNEGRDGGVSDPLCLEGAIGAALGIDADEMQFFMQVTLIQCPAAAAVHSYLNLVEGGRLWEWNDTVAEDGHTYVRTAAEVIEVLRATAVIEAAREDATAPVEVSA